MSNESGAYNLPGLLPGSYKVSAELQVVLAQTLRDVVAKGISGIGVEPGECGRPFAESTAVSPVGGCAEIGQLSPKVGEQTGHREIAAAGPHLRIRV